MRSYLYFALLISLCVPIALWAQITFTSTDLPFNPGTEIDLEHNLFTSPIPLDPGPAGEDQAWDFSSVVVDIEFHHSWIEPTTAPGYAYFPNANRCKQYGDNYEYMHVSGLGLWWLGFYDDGSGDTTIFHDGEPVWAFPCTYGNTWTTTFWSCLPFGPGTLEDSIDFVVDGWGTITDLMGTFDCIRIKGHHTMTVNNPPYSMVTTQWGYYWFVLGKGHMVYMESVPPDTMEQFTSGYFRRMTSISSGVRPVNQGSALPTQVTLLPAYPNPFNPGTQLTFSLPKSGDVILAVYNLQGQEVAQVVNGWYTPGSYNATLDASMLTSGIYLARLQANGLTVTQKLTLLK